MLRGRRGRGRRRWGCEDECKDKCENKHEGGEGDEDEGRIKVDWVDATTRRASQDSDHMIHQDSEWSNGYELFA